MKNKERLGPALSVLSVVLVGASIYYLSSAIQQVEKLEDKLEYRPPSLAKIDVEQATGADQRHSTYIPVYSHIYSGGGQAVQLQTTLSIRNTDPNLPLNLHSVSYYNSEGALIREHLETSVSLAPMATASYLVDLHDTAGGSGANFLVQWSSSRQNALPVMEAVMIATEGKPLSFNTRGVLIPGNTTSE